MRGVAPAVESRVGHGRARRAHQLREVDERGGAHHQDLPVHLLVRFRDGGDQCVQIVQCKRPPEGDDLGRGG